LDGRKLQVNVPAGVVKPGQKSVVTGEGMPIRKDGQVRRKGDLWVQWNVVFPDNLTPSQKEGLRKVLGWARGLDFLRSSCIVALYQLRTLYTSLWSTVKRRKFSLSAADVASSSTQASTSAHFSRRPGRHAFASRQPRSRKSTPQAALADVDSETRRPRESAANFNLGDGNADKAQEKSKPELLCPHGLF